MARCIQNNKAGLRGQLLPPPGPFGLLSTSRLLQATTGRACVHTHTHSSPGISGGHSQPDRLSLPILCFLCLSGQGVRFQRMEGEHGDNAGLQEPSPSTSISAPAPPSPPGGQGGRAERLSHLEKGHNHPLIQALGTREAAPFEALPDSSVPGPRASGYPGKGHLSIFI